MRLENSISGNIKFFFNLGDRQLHFRKYKKFFNLEARKLHFLKCKKFFRGGFFFIFPSLGLKVRQTAAYTTNIWTKMEISQEAKELFA